MIEEVLEDPRIDGGGYRAKKRVNRGGNDSANLTYCRGFSDIVNMLLWMPLSWFDMRLKVDVRTTLVNLKFAFRASTPKFQPRPTPTTHCYGYLSWETPTLMHIRQS